LQQASHRAYCKHAGTHAVHVCTCCVMRHDDGCVVYPSWPACCTGPACPSTATGVCCVCVRRFSTGAGVSSSDALIQEHYAKEVSNSIGPVSICTCTNASKQQTVQLSVLERSRAVLLISELQAEAYAADSAAVVPLTAASAVCCRRISAAAVPLVTPWLGAGCC
jgi:hypothetical protein